MNPTEIQIANYIKVLKSVIPDLEAQGYYQEGIGQEKIEDLRVLIVRLEDELSKLTK